MANAETLGRMSLVSGNCVTPTRFVPDATAELLAFFSGNTAPKNGQDVLVDLTVTNLSATTTRLSTSLRPILNGGNGVKYPSYACSAVVPADLATEATVGSGATFTGGVCFDVPPAALPGAMLVLTSQRISKVFYKLP